jgi:hypothetical protein
MSTHFSSSDMPQPNNRSSSSKRGLILNICLALLPFFSFLGQYLFSINAGTEQILFHHQTVMIVDWIFIPFNFYVISIIDWKQGGKIYLCTIVSVILNIATHGFWQYNRLDPGHMFTKSGIILPAGWVHLAFSILETILLFAFVFCRKTEAPRIKLVTIFATIYFLTMGISGYTIQHKIILSDAIVVVCGLFFVCIYPRLRGSAIRPHD